MKTSHIVLYAVVLLFTVLIRLAPSLYTNNVFSNDVWPLKRLTEYMLKNPNANIYSLYEIYGHHVFWPISVLQGIVYIHVTGIHLDYFFKFAGVAILSIGMFLSVYLLAKRYSYEYRCCLAASLVITLLPSFTLFTSAYLKEFYGYALTPILLYLSIHGSRSRLPLLPILISVALVLSHPLASAMGIAILCSYLYVNLVSSLKDRKKFNIRFEHIVAIVSLAMVYALYSTFIAKPVIPISLTDLVILGIYAIAVYLAYLFLGGVTSTSLIAIASLLASTSIIYTITVPINNILLLLYVIPPIISIAYRVREGSLGRIKSAVLLPIVVLFLYIPTYMVEALGIIHRIVNYFVYAFIPMGIDIPKNSRKISTAILLILVLATITCSLASTLNHNLYTFYWRYGGYDNVFKNFIEVHALSINIYGDPKYSYMTPKIVGIPITIIKELCEEPDFLVLSRDNLVYGIPITPVDLYKSPCDLFMNRNIVFNVGYLYVFA
ncbi:MAG: hypothetical protein QW162_06915 [Ignisphaera sp.]